MIPALRVNTSRGVRWSALAIVLLGSAVWAIVAWNHWSSVRLPNGVTSNDYARVARELKLAQRREPQEAEVFFRLGTDLLDERDWPTACACFAAIPEGHRRYGPGAVFMRAQALFQMDRLPESEELFRHFLDREDQSPSVWVTADDRIVAKHFISLILALELRFEERRTFMWEMIEQHEADLFDTLAGCYPTLMEWYTKAGARHLEDATRADPRNVDLRAVLSLYRLGEGRVEEALLLVTACRKEAPDDRRVLAAWLACQYETADWDGLARSIAELPPPRDDDPWLLLRSRGQAHLRQGENLAAAECFQRVLARDPANAESHLGMARVCRQMDQPKEHERHLAAAQALARIQNRMGWAAARNVSPAPLAEIAELSWSIGLRKECRAVAEAGLRAFPEDQRLEKLKRQCESEQKGKLPE